MARDATESVFMVNRRYYLICLLSLSISISLSLSLSVSLFLFLFCTFFVLAFIRAVKLSLKKCLSFVKRLNNRSAFVRCCQTFFFGQTFSAKFKRAFVGRHYRRHAYVLCAHVLTNCMSLSLHTQYYPSELEEEEKLDELARRADLQNERRESNAREEELHDEVHLCVLARAWCACVVIVCM